MWRMRSVTVLGVLVGVLLLGAAIAEAGWYWNARIDVEGTDVRTIWRVVGDNDGSSNYHATIDVSLPEGAQAALLSGADTETVTIATDPGLECSSDGIQGTVTYNVSSLTDEVGQKVKVTIEADGKTIGHGTGELGEDISVAITIPVANASCD